MKRKGKILSLVIKKDKSYIIFSYFLSKKLPQSLSQAQ